MEQDFHGNFQVNVTCFFFFFCVFLLSLTGLSSFWHGLKDIFTLYKLAADKVGLDHYKWLRQKRRRDVDPHGRLQADRGVEVYFFQGFVHTYIHWYTGHIHFNDRSLRSF